ncbi:MFS transporter [Amycolatopsis sp. GM8]|uniref:MFS transporter n=1 Tax=Amycolatopsis sp. GM8 TaxID=2896530 RepID=UPI001F021AD7|nr:MFS transporter [Amycolatopsis sp. GM8]
MLFARVPIAAMGYTLTLHVVADLGRGYGEAGLVGTMTTVGSAVGSPLVGRMIDRCGLRPVVLVCGVVSTAYWVSTPRLPYPVLVCVALVAGMLVVPVSSISRQVLTALTPTELRRSAYSLDSISLEASFMVGPAAGVAVATQVSASVALVGIGVWFAAVSVALWWFNPPVRHEQDVVEGPRPKPRDWLTRRLVATLVIATGAVFCLAGTEIAVLAALRETGEAGWAGVVIIGLCVASIIGGLAHGGVQRSLSLPVLLVLLCLLTIPAGLFAHPWWLLALALFPANLACAPTLASTAEVVSRVAPARVRGEAMGLLDSASRLGAALGSPVVGFTMDHSSAAAGFAAAGLGGLAIASTGLLLQVGRRVSVSSVK